MPYLDSASHELPFASGSDTSEAAAVKAKSFVGRQGRDVLGFIQASGSGGVTQREASIGLEIGRPSIAARFHALERQGLIRKVIGVRRDGCNAYEAT